MSLRQNQLVRIESKRHVANAICLQVFRTTIELAPLLATLTKRKPARLNVRRAAWFAYCDEQGRVIDFVAMQDRDADWWEMDGKHLHISPA